MEKMKALLQNITNILQDFSVCLKSFYRSGKSSDTIFHHFDEEIEPWRLVSLRILAILGTVWYNQNLEYLIFSEASLFW